MKITGTTSMITFDLEDGHVVKATGEMLLNRTFAVDTASMTHWDPPFEDEPLTKEDVEQIMGMAMEQIDMNTIKLIFEQRRRQNDAKLF